MCLNHINIVGRTGVNPVRSFLCLIVHHWLLNWVSHVVLTGVTNAVPVHPRCKRGRGRQTDDSYKTTDFTYSIGNDATHDDIKRTDFGIGLNAGYQIDNGLFFRAHYQRGFVNLLPGGDTNNTEFSTNYGVSVGYLFGAGGAHKHSKTTTVRVHRN